jgi:hypothetical protein
MAIDPEFKARWVEALKSGAYTQCYSVLREGNRFCAIGVACDLMDPNGWDPGAGETDEELRPWRGESSLMEKTAAAEIGLTEHEQADVVNLNDQDTMTFPEIAQWIEAKL